MDYRRLLKIMLAVSFVFSVIAMDTQIAWSQTRTNTAQNTYKKKLLERTIEERLAVQYKPRHATVSKVQVIDYINHDGLSEPLYKFNLDRRPFYGFAGNYAAPLPSKHQISHMYVKGKRLSILGAVNDDSIVKVTVKLAGIPLGESPVTHNQFFFVKTPVQLLDLREWSYIVLDGINMHGHSVVQYKIKNPSDGGFFIFSKALFHGILAKVQQR